LKLHLPIFEAAFCAQALPAERRPDRSTSEPSYAMRRCAQDRWTALQGEGTPWRDPNSLRFCAFNRLTSMHEHCVLFLDQLCRFINDDRTSPGTGLLSKRAGKPSTRRHHAALRILWSTSSVRSTAAYVLSVLARR